VTRLEERVVARVTERIGKRKGLTRRSFLTRTAVVGSALAVNPLQYIFKPGTAYAAAGCGPAADCGSGWTVMCCSINGGANSCPPGTLAAGWWKADRSGFCGGGARYYIDCNSTCSCGCGASGICAPGCWSCGCRCNTGSCDTRRVCCNEFRYGQCNTHVGCVGPVVCRVISCAPPWQFENCTTASATSNTTALHDAPCLHEHQSQVFAFGAAAYKGQPQPGLHEPVVGMDSTKTGNGYWLVAADGGVFTFGDAKFHGSMGGQHLNLPIVDLARTKSSRGYWLVALDGGIFSFGDAKFYGSTGHMRLNKPIIGMAATPSGAGYWLVATDGGIFSFGDAKFYGSTGHMRLNKPIAGMAATPSGKGYWLVATDGGVFTFGDAKFLGSMGSTRLRSPITAIAPTPTGKGYWMLGEDGGVFSFGDARYFGVIGNRRRGVAADMEPAKNGDGYWITTTT
jgi:hypothetical protein